MIVAQNLIEMGVLIFYTIQEHAIFEGGEKQFS